MAGTETPASRARKIKKQSEEFESVNNASTKRNRLKFPSKPRKESFGASPVEFEGVFGRGKDSRMKKISTTTAAKAGTAASKNILVNSLEFEAFRLATTKYTRKQPRST